MQDIARHAPTPHLCAMVGWMVTSVMTGIMGRLPNGAEIIRFSLATSSLRVTLMNLGATILSIELPSRKGGWENVVLSNYEVLDYIAPNKAYFGATCGRYANRVNGGSFRIDGVRYELSRNEPPHTTLHGGERGFDACLWQAAIAEDSVVLSLNSPDGDQGFPGALSVRLTFTLTKSSLRLKYESTTNKQTHVNLTNHSYFNLAGEGKGDVLDHQLSLEADCYLPNDEHFLPTGIILPVVGTPFDFRRVRTIGQGFKKTDPQLLANRGYNHTFALRHSGSYLAPAAVLIHPATGRSLCIQTTEPGVHLYTGGFLDGTHRGPSGVPYAAHAGLCLETQHFPDSPSHVEFPPTLLRPGEILHSETVYTLPLVSEG